MIKLRWFRRRKRASAALIRTYAHEHDLSVRAAQQELLGNVPPFVLQQQDEQTGEWFDVPSVEETIEVETC